jgi:hypothetical protein
VEAVEVERWRRWRELMAVVAGVDGGGGGEVEAVEGVDGGGGGTVDAAAAAERWRLGLERGNMGVWVGFDGAILTGREWIWPVGRPVRFGRCRMLVAAVLM